MPLPLEAVPNFSEGRSAVVVDALRESLSRRAHVLDVHIDSDHNRSVFTLAGSADDLVEVLLAGIACARERIDLRRHEGVHPRVGVADIVPVVAVWPDQLDEAKDAALHLARRVGDELGLPVFLYAELAPGRRPAHLRRGGISDLQHRIDAGEIRPDFGPNRLDLSAGCVLVGARRPLVAFNVDLDTTDVAVAKEIAAVVRESGGGFPGVLALGLPLPSRGLTQVSMNIEDWRVAPLEDVVRRVGSEAAARGIAVAGAELVGLMPEGAAAAGAEALLLERLDEAMLLEPSLSRLAA